MDFRYLSAFVAIGKNGSLSSAARELGIAVSAISRQLNLLEESVGQILFERHARKLVLTKVGRDLLQSTLKFTESAEQLLNKTPGFSPIRIGCLQSIFEDKLLGFIKKHHHDMPLDIAVGPPAWLMDQLRQGNLNIVISNKTSDMSGADAIHVYDEIPCLAANHHNVEGFNTRIVFVPYEDIWGRVPVSYQNTIRVNSLNAALELTKSEVGSTIIPLSLAKKHHLKKATPITGARQPVYFCTEKLKKTPSHIAAFLSKFRKMERESS
ncbi:MAG: LysR family transcriptional regulator [Bdellovibrionota bacterium]